MKILIAGDFCQRYRVDEKIKQKKYNELFDEVKPDVESADYSIVNFEFPIVLNSSVAKPITKCGPNLFGTIEAVEAIKYVGFDCCTLANNHILDQGEQCCLDTKSELEKAKIDTVGVGKNNIEAGQILYKVIKDEKIAIINCCEHEFSIATNTTAGANPLNNIQQYYKIKEARKNANYVLVIVHGGHELYSLPSTRMQETYRFFIEAGADAVVNHHQHVFSGYESYKGCPIFYGLGNFLFDSKEKPSPWNEGYMVDIDTKKRTFRTIPYKQCLDSPRIEFLSSKCSLLFNEKIKKLNDIIANEEILKEKFSVFTRRCAKDMKLMLSPYGNLYLRELSKRGYLPSLVSTKKLVDVINYVDCESHRDIFIDAIKSYIK